MKAELELAIVGGANAMIGIEALRLGGWRENMSGFRT